MEIKRYIALIWHWLWLIILGVILAGGIAFAINNNSPRIYRSSPVRLLIDEAPGQSYSEILVEKSLTQTYVELIKTRPILEDTVSKLDLPFSSDDLLGRVSVSTPLEAQIIDIAVTDGEPRRAADIANTIATVFIVKNDERQSLRYSESISRYEDAVNELRDERQEIQTQINQLGTPSTAEDEAMLSRLETQLNELELRHTQTFNDLESVRVDQAKENSNVVIIEEAQANYSHIRPQTTRNTLLAAMLGGLLALGIVFMIDYLDDTVKTPDDVMQDTGLSTLGAIAYIKGDNTAERLITQRMPRAPVSEAFRVLRTNLSFSAVDQELKSLLITSSSPGEGKSTTTANLAVVMAQTGQKVIIVDADLRRPTQHKIFNLANNHGLTMAILDSETSITDHVQDTNIAGLQVMTSGPIPPNPSELLNSQRMRAILGTLQEAADFIILDTPPALSVADASILAPQVSGCALVVQVGETRRDIVVQAVERLHNTGANLYGVVMNRLRAGRSGYYEYYYRYYAYEYEYRNRSSFGRSSLRIPRWLSGLSNR